MLVQLKKLLFFLASIAGFLFTFALQLKLVNFIDSSTGVMKYRNKIAMYSLAFMVVYYLLTFILPTDSAQAVQGGAVSESPEPLDADVEEVPGENKTKTL